MTQGEVVSDPSWDALNGIVAMVHACEPFKLSATFAIVSPVTIRSGLETESGSDVVHLTSQRDDKDGVPMILGTSLVGVIRAGALRIAQTMAEPNHDRADRFIKGMFGDMGKQGRVTIDEIILFGQTKPIQIVRFPVRAFESASFAEEITGKFALGLSLRASQDAEVGLLLLVMKDLWTGFLPVGIRRNAGYGQLKGLKAALHYRGVEWTLTASPDSGGPIIVVPSQGMATVGLNNYVTAFKNEMEGKS